MADTCRERIVAAVAAQLAAIDGVTGLTVERDGVDAIEDAALPLLMVYDRDETPVDMYLGEDAFELQVEIEGVAEGDTAAAAAAALGTLRGRVEAALLADITLGGLARDLRPDAEPAPEPLSFDQASRPTKGFARTYVITYATREGDPFTFA